MFTHEIVLSLDVTPARVRAVLVAGLMTLLPRFCSTADVSSLDFYYPPTVGYVNQETSVGTSYLARHTGNVTFGAGNHNAVFVRAGDPPSTTNDGPEGGAPNLKLSVRCRSGAPRCASTARAMNVDGCIAFSGNGGSDPNVWRCKFN